MTIGEASGKSTNKTGGYNDGHNKHNQSLTNLMTPNMIKKYSEN
jgi:hypothetical protein